MAKNNAAEKRSSLHETVKNIAKDGIGIIAQIDQLDLEERSLKLQLPSIDEQIAVSNRRVDESAEVYKTAVRNPYSAPSLIPPAPLDEHLVSLDMVDGYFAFHFRDEIKQRREAWIRSLETGQEIRSDEKVPRLAEISEKRLALWKEYEAGCVELEAAGFHVDRDPRVPPSIFLNLNGASWDVAKYERLRRRQKSFGGVRADIEHRRQHLLERKVAFERERQGMMNRPSVRTADLEYIDKQASDIQAEETKLNSEYTENAKENAGVTRLLERCQRLLREHHLIGSKFSVALP
jgi:hypothetical protein